MTKRNAKPDWDQLVRQYACANFIQSDPIQFPHRYTANPDWRDIELSGFLAAMFSYGRRDLIIGALNHILSPLGPHPVEGLLSLSPRQLNKHYGEFYYRFQKSGDLIFLLSRLQEIYRHTGSLKLLWQSVYQTHGPDMQACIHHFKTRLLTDTPLPCPDSYGMKFLMADPALGSAAKRFNMFLRWMVRRDDVDFGLWSDITPPAHLMMPVDTHVSKIARRYRITRRKTDNWQTVEEITHYFRRYCPQDPVRYDFALFGLGIDGDPPKSTP